MIAADWQASTASDHGFCNQLQRTDHTGVMNDAENREITEILASYECLRPSLFFSVRPSPAAMRNHGHKSLAMWV